MSGPLEFNSTMHHDRSNRYSSDFINGRVTRNGDDVNASPGMQRASNPGAHLWHAYTYLKAWQLEAAYGHVLHAIRISIRLMHRHRGEKKVCTFSPIPCFTSRTIGTISSDLSDKTRAQKRACISWKLYRLIAIFNWTDWTAFHVLNVVNQEKRVFHVIVQRCCRRINGSISVGRLIWWSCEVDFIRLIV